ncbi:hypothetical protein DPMN_057153 [Dreissena polymorpha]|uniref:Uncharacterized protein n=1 Tax=Dreissena polymorpha TaxID=45954 RepID=A0A9D4CTW9_DREPO|nr:hypothetical protein DPMN_057153 [Dreissena polymorpha]
MRQYDDDNATVRQYDGDTFSSGNFRVLLNEFRSSWLKAGETKRYEVVLPVSTAPVPGSHRENQEHELPVRNAHCYEGTKSEVRPLWSRNDTMYLASTPDE